jgi:hypothetical protein
LANPNNNLLEKSHTLLSESRNHQSIGLDARSSQQSYSQGAPGTNYEGPPIYSTKYMEARLTEARDSYQQQQDVANDNNLVVTEMGDD